MGNSRIGLRIESRLKEDFENCVPNSSAFLRQCIIERVYGTDSTKWPAYIRVKGYIPVRSTLAGGGEAVGIYTSHLGSSTVSAMDVPPEGVLREEDVNEGILGDGGSTVTLDQMIEEIKRETK